MDVPFDATYIKSKDCFYDFKNNKFYSLSKLPTISSRSIREYDEVPNFTNFSDILFYDVETSQTQYNIVLPSEPDFCNKARVKSIVLYNSTTNILYIFIDQTMTYTTKPLYNIPEDKTYLIENNSFIIDENTKHKYNDIIFFKSSTICLSFLSLVYSLRNPLLIGYNSSHTKNNIDFSDTSLIFKIGYDYPAVLRSAYSEHNNDPLKTYQHVIDKIESCKPVITSAKSITAKKQIYLLQYHVIYHFDLQSYIEIKFVKSGRGGKFNDFVMKHGNKLESWVNKECKLKKYDFYDHPIYRKCYSENDSYSKKIVKFINKHLGSIYFNRTNTENCYDAIMYNIMDVYCTFKLFESIQPLTYIHSLMAGLDLPYSVVLLPMSHVNKIIITRILEKPNNQSYLRLFKIYDKHIKEMPDIQFKGGRVNSSHKGKHKIILYQDYNSLYPNIIITHNICFTTYIGNSLTGIYDEYKHIPDTSINKIRIEDVGITVYYRTDIKGIIPIFLETLFNDRKYLKDLGKDELQEPLKIVLNSIYGVMGSKHFDYGSKIIGASVTQKSREVKSYAEKLALSIFLYIVAGDTDSNMLASSKSIPNSKSYNQLLNEWPQETNDYYNYFIKNRTDYSDTLLQETYYFINNVDIRLFNQYNTLSKKINKIFNDYFIQENLNRLKLSVEDVMTSFYYPGYKKRYAYLEPYISEERKYKQRKDKTVTDSSIERQIELNKKDPHYRYSYDIKIKGYKYSQYSKTCSNKIESFMEYVLTENEIDLTEAYKEYITHIYDLDVSELHNYYKIIRKNKNDLMTIYTDLVITKNTIIPHIQNNTLSFIESSTLFDTSYEGTLNLSAPVYRTTTALNTRIRNIEESIQTQNVPNETEDDEEEIDDDEENTIEEIKDVINYIQIYLYKEQNLLYNFFIDVHEYIPTFSQDVEDSYRLSVLKHTLEWFGFGKLNTSRHVSMSIDKMCSEFDKDIISDDDKEIPISQILEYRGLGYDIIPKVMSESYQSVNLTRTRESGRISRAIVKYANITFEEHSTKLEKYRQKNCYSAAFNCGMQDNGSYIIGIDIDIERNKITYPEVETLSIFPSSIFNFGCTSKKGRHLVFELTTDHPDNIYTLPLINQSVNLEVGQIEYKGIPSINNKIVSNKNIEIIGKHRKDKEFTYELFGSFSNIPQIKDVDFINMINIGLINRNNDPTYIYDIVYDYKEENYPIIYGKKYRNQMVLSKDIADLYSIEYLENALKNVTISSGDINTNDFATDQSIIDDIISAISSLTYESFWTDRVKIFHLKCLIYPILTQIEIDLIQQQIFNLPEFQRVSNKHDKLSFANISKYSQDINKSGLREFNIYTNNIQARINQINKKLNHRITSTFTTHEQISIEHYNDQSTADIVCVKAHVGSGKTENLLPHLYTKYPDQKIIFFTNRSSQIDDLYSKLIRDNKSTVKIYGKNRDEDRLEITQQYCLAQLESLCRLQKISDSDDYVVVIDEAICFMFQISSDGVPEYKEHNILIMEKLIKNAHKIYLLDALLNDKCIEFFSKIRNSTSLNIINSTYNKMTPQYTTYDYKTMSKQFYYNLNQALRTHPKVTICTDRKSVAISIKKQMVDPLNKRCKLIVGATLGELDPNLTVSNAEDVTLEDEVVIYTSKLIHTKSFNETNFPSTIVFGIFSNNDVSAYEKFQMLTRTRLAQEIHILSSQRKDFELPSKWTYHKTHAFFSQYNPKFISVFQGPSKEKTFQAGTLITEARYLRDSFQKINLNKETLEEFSGCINYNKPVIEYVPSENHGEFNIFIEQISKPKDQKPITEISVAKCNGTEALRQSYELNIIQDYIIQINKTLPTPQNQTLTLTSDEYAKLIIHFKKHYEDFLYRTNKGKKDYSEMHIKKIISEKINSSNLWTCSIIEIDRGRRSTRDRTNVSFNIILNTQTARS